MQQPWTVLQHVGPNHLGLWSNQAGELAPSACPAECAGVFLPWWAACGGSATGIATVGGEDDQVHRQLQVSRGLQLQSRRRVPTTAAVS